MCSKASEEELLGLCFIDRGDSTGLFNIWEWVNKLTLTGSHTPALLPERSRFPLPLPVLNYLEERSSQLLLWLHLVASWPWEWQGIQISCQNLRACLLLLFVFLWPGSHFVSFYFVGKLLRIIPEEMIWVTTEIAPPAIGTLCKSMLNFSTLVANNFLACFS